MTETEEEKERCSIWFMSELLAQKFLGRLNRNSINVSAYVQDTLVIMKRELTEEENEVMYD